MIKHINITNADIVKSMSDETKHNFANHCIINKVQPEEIIELVKNVTNGVVNCVIDLCNNYFETPAGKEYLQMRKNIEKIGVIK